MIASLQPIPLIQTVHGLTYRVNPVVAPEKRAERGPTNETRPEPTKTVDPKEVASGVVG